MTIDAMNPRAMTVRDLLGDSAEMPAALGMTVISGLALDSRQLRPGHAFVALAGAHSHGLRHAGEAARRGAACVLFEAPAPADIELPANALPVPGLRQQLGGIADRFFDSPSAALAVIGVTGTNGKTSTVQLIAQAMDRLGRGPCGTLGTLGLGLAGELRAGERTTPDVISVHAAIDELRERGARALAMEVSSHALDQGRVDAVRFRIAVFTNLSHDHLDYHGDMASYGEAKARLLQWPALQARIINIDDAFGAELAARDGAGALWTHSSRGNALARLRADAIVLDAAGLGFDLVEAAQRVAVRSPLFGRFNVDNLLAVVGCLRAMDVPLQAIGELFARLSPVAGRMNRIDGPADAPLVVVDYAHTPDALQQALDSLRAHTPGRLVCVFGCGGERDRGKRPRMGAIAEASADRIIITDDNPRHEDGNAIVAEIRAGLADPDAATVERDRGRAIALAIGEAAAGDIVLIAGKGHEPYQQIADFRLPFDDADVARSVLEDRA